MSAAPSSASALSALERLGLSEALRCWLLIEPGQARMLAALVLAAPEVAPFARLLAASAWPGAHDRPATDRHIKTRITKLNSLWRPVANGPSGGAATIHRLRNALDDVGVIEASRARRRPQRLISIRSVRAVGYAMTSADADAILRGVFAHYGMSEERFGVRAERRAS